VVELWQLQQLGDPSTARPALVMLWHLAHCWQQQQQQQQHQQNDEHQQGQSSIGLYVQDLLQLLLPVLQQQYQQQLLPGEEAADVAALSLRVFAKLRYLPPAPLLNCLCGHVEAAAAAGRLSPQQLVTAAAAAVQLGYMPHTVAAAAVEKAMRQEQQKGRRLPPEVKVQLLWVMLLCGFKSPGHPQADRALADRHTLLGLAAAVAAIPQQRVLQNPHLVKLVMDCRLLLSTGRLRSRRQDLRLQKILLPLPAATDVVHHLAELSAALSGSGMVLSEGLVACSKQQVAKQLQECSLQQR